MKIVKYLENSGILLKGASKTIQNAAKEQKGGLLSILLDTLGATVLGNILTSKGINRVGEGIIRASYGCKRSSKKPLIKDLWFKKKFLDSTRFNWPYSEDILPDTIKNGTYVINLDRYSDVGTHWIALYSKNKITYLKVLVLNIFKKKLQNSLRNLQMRQTFSEYKHMIQ